MSPLSRRLAFAGEGAAIRPPLLAACVATVLLAIALLVPLISPPSATPPSPVEITPTPRTEPSPVDTSPAPRTEPSPSPRPTTEPDIGISHTGLHFTPEEVLEWRRRSELGPYRVRDDAAANSPGDWDRMTSRAEDFRRDPAAGRWHGPDRDGCIQQHDEAPPVAPASALRDAAFITLVRGRSPYEGLVRDELVAQSRTNGVDFSNTDRWCGGVLLDVNPSFEVAQWLTKHLFAYDYLGPEVFTREERSQLDSWFRDAARFFQRDLDASLDRLFRNRASGDYRPVERLDKDPRCSSLPYYGGPSICSLARHYNNRHASIASFVGLVGVHQGDTSLQESASNFVKEFVMFGVFPEGFVGDFERWTGELPDLGWAYGNGTLGAAVTVADALARAGDTRLYEYETPEGAFGTQGGPKSLHFAIRSMGQYVDGTFERYATADPEKVGDPTYRINGSAPHRGWYGVHDVWYSQANRHYQDPYLRDMYTRGGHGMAPYPKSPAPGEWELWEGEGGVYPGVLFMFGQMEHIGS